MNQKQIARLKHLKLIPTIGEGMEDLFFWLEKEKLVQPASTYEQQMQIGNPMLAPDRIVTFSTLAVPTSRAQAFTATQRDATTLRKLATESKSNEIRVRNLFKGVLKEPAASGDGTPDTGGKQI